MALEFNARNGLSVGASPKVVVSSTGGGDFTTLNVSNYAYFTSGGSCINLKAGTADHCYLSFFPRTADPGIRGAYLGFPATGGVALTLRNEIAGGGITLATTGGGQIALSGGDTVGQRFAVVSAGPTAFSARNTSDSNTRWGVGIDGTVFFGDGVAGPDTTLSRLSAGELKINTNKIWHGGNFDPTTKVSTSNYNFPTSLASDLQTLNNEGVWFAEAKTGCTNQPEATKEGAFSQLADAGGTDVKYQTWARSDGNELYFQVQWGNGNWRGWKRIWHSGNFTPTTPITPVVTKSWYYETSLALADKQPVYGIRAPLTLQGIRVYLGATQAPTAAAGIKIQKQTGTTWADWATLVLPTSITPGQWLSMSINEAETGITPNLAAGDSLRAQVTGTGTGWSDFTVELEFTQTGNRP